MCFTLDNNKNWKQFNDDRFKISNREQSSKSCLDDDLIEDNLRQRIRSLETNLFAEYCSELPIVRVEQHCGRR